VAGGERLEGAQRVLDPSALECRYVPEISGKVDPIRVLDELREIVVGHILNVLRGRGSTPCAGTIMQDTYTSTNQSIEQYWFLREGEAGLHMFHPRILLQRVPAIPQWNGRAEGSIPAELCAVDASVSQ
jgi:hypothetical protein